jgi:hypothetical protein
MCRCLSAFALALLIAGFPALPAVAADAPLDGTTWVIKNKDGKVQDTIRFRNGEFMSVESIPFGYRNGAYRTSRTGKATKWTAVQKSVDNNKLQWQGQWDGKSTRMTGSYTRTTEDGKQLQPVKWTATRKKAA